MNTASNKTKGRMAGAIYLLVVLTGIFSLGYVPNQLIVWNDPAKTFQNIRLLFVTMAVAITTTAYSGR